ncbi:MAG: hypothetical protein AAFY63_08345, partial [Cyanobacteria bacterium J06643_13]
IYLDKYLGKTIYLRLNNYAKKIVRDECIINAVKQSFLKLSCCTPSIFRSRIKTLNQNIKLQTKIILLNGISGHNQIPRGN